MFTYVPFKKTISVDTSPFCGAIDTLLVSKPGWILLLACFVTCAPDSSDYSLVWHLLTSSRPAWQVRRFIHILALSYNKNAKPLLNNTKCEYSTKQTTQPNGNLTSFTKEFWRQLQNVFYWLVEVQLVHWMKAVAEDLGKCFGCFMIISWWSIS